MAEDFRFLLNMQIVADGIEDVFPGMQFCPGEDASVLEAVNFYTADAQSFENRIYIASADELKGSCPPEGHCAIVAAGTVPPKWNNGRNSVIILPEDTDLRLLMNTCQNVFTENRNFAARLRNIVMQDGSVDELCEEGYRYFKNPLFVHDSHLNIISCPEWREGMIRWKEDKKSGLTITPLEDLNELKTDREYQETLYKRGADIYSANLRGYRDIYVNLWNEYGAYEGRIVICEIDTPFKPGQMAAAEYFEKLVRLTLAKRRNTDKSNKRMFDSMVLGLLQGNEYEDEEIESLISQVNWRMDDEYICICMDAGEGEGIVGSVASVCNQVEGKIPGSKAVAVDSGICVIVNRTINSGYASQLVYILRDGLFKAGYGTPFHGFDKLRRQYLKAKIALEYCKKTNGMWWYFDFDNIAVEYAADQCCAELHPEELCASELMRLMEYDEENGTELYKTLKTYILNERNTVAASKELFIGRSTLFYRLKKVKEVTGLDADKISDPEKNLYLRLSIYILERSGGDKGKV